MSKIVLIVNDAGKDVGRCDERVAELLEKAPDAPEAIKFLEDLRRRKLRLKCPCGRILHTVQRQSLFLRLNPKQDVKGPECPLCESTFDGITGSQAARPLSSQAQIGLILASRHMEEKDERERAEQTGGGGGSLRMRLRYAGAFTVLWKLMEGAGFLELPAPIGWTPAWEHLHRSLNKLPVIHEGYMSDFVWMPGRLYQGGLRGLNERLLGSWRHPKMQAEGWVFAMIAERPEEDEMLFWSVPESMRRRVAETEANKYKPYRIHVPHSNYSVVGRSGPYLALAVCSANTEGDAAFRKPSFHRVIMQAVAGEHNPVPVESSYEREVVLLLQRHEIRFIKPVFSVAEDLRPDFMLPDLKVVLEVQGMMSEEYREHKRVKHQEMLDRWRPYGYQLLTYRPNEGQTLRDFEANLLSI